MQIPGPETLEQAASLKSLGDHKVYTSLWSAFHPFSPCVIDHKLLFMAAVLAAVGFASRTTL